MAPFPSTVAHHHPKAPAYPLTLDHLLTTSKVCRNWRVHSTPTAHQAMAALPRVRAFLNMSVQGLQPKSPWSWPSWKPSLLRLWGRYQSVPQQYLRHQETLSTMTLRLFEFCIKKKKEFFKKRLLLVTATRLASTSRRHTEANIKIHIIQDQKQRSQFPLSTLQKAHSKPFQPSPPGVAHRRVGRWSR